MGFSIGSVFNNATLTQAKNEHKVQYIERTKLKANDKNQNYYNMKGVEALSYGIEDNGLLQPIVIMPDVNEADTYIILSGHRRFEAIKLIVERNPDMFETIPCIVREDVNDDEELLIDGNVYNRQQSPAERLRELEAKKAILQKRKGRGEKVSGNLLKLISEEMEISYHQAKKFNSITLNATPSVREAFDKGDISTETAYELSKLDDKMQDDILGKANDEDKQLTAKDVRKITEVKEPLFANEKSQEDVSVQAEEKTVVSLKSTSSPSAEKPVEDVEPKEQDSLNILDKISFIRCCLAYEQTDPQDKKLSIQYCDEVLDYINNHIEKSIDKFVNS